MTKYKYGTRGNRMQKGSLVVQGDVPGGVWSRRGCGDRWS